MGSFPRACGWITTGYLFSYELADLADYYLAYRRLVEHWKDILPSGTLLTVRYEDVVHSPAEQSARILEFLGLPWEEATLRFHESRAPSATASAVQVRRPIYADSLDAWRRHARALARQAPQVLPRAGGRGLGTALKNREAPVRGQPRSGTT